MVSKLKNKLILMSGIGVVLGAVLLIVSMLVTSISWVQILGTVLFIMGACLMLSTTGNRNNISIIFSFFTIIGVIISSIFFILMAFGIIEIRTSMFSKPGIATIIFPFILAFTVGSATLTYLTSIVSETDTIKTLRNLVAGLTVGIAVMTIISVFIGVLAQQLLSIVIIAEIVLAVITLFLVVLDKQESLETISILTIKCRELQQQTTKLEQDLNIQTSKQQTTQAELDRLQKNNQELKTNIEYYNKLYTETKQEALYTQQQLMAISQQTPQEATGINTSIIQTQPIKTVQAISKVSPIPTINYENNN